MSKRKQHALECKVQVALKGEETVSELASQFGVHPTTCQCTFRPFGQIRRMMGEPAMWCVGTSSPAFRRRRSCSARHRCRPGTVVSSLYRA